MSTVIFVIPTDLTALLDKEKAAEARATVRANPGHALTLLTQGHASGALTLAGQSRLLEEILGEIADPDEAAELVSQHLVGEAAAEMIAVRGDLPSVASSLVDADIVIAALIEDATETPALISILVKAWAIKLQDREDWEELLEHKIGKYSLRDYLIAAVAKEAQDEDPSADEWDDVGLDPDEAAERLEEMRADGKLPKFSADDAENALQVLRERRKTFDEAPTIAETTAEVAKEIEI